MLSLYGSERIALTGFLPKAEPSQERIGVVTRSAMLGHLFQFLDVASPQYHVIGFESGNQAGYHVRDISPPFLFAQPIQSADADVVFEGALLVRKMAQLHRLDDAFHNECGT